MIMKEMHGVTRTLQSLFIKRKRLYILEEKQPGKYRKCKFLKGGGVVVCTPPLDTRLGSTSTCAKD